MDQGEVSEVWVFISTNLEWDCGSLSFSACTTTQDWLRKSYIYIEKPRKALKWYIYYKEMVPQEQPNSTHCILRRINSNSFEFLFNPDPSQVNCFDIN